MEIIDDLHDALAQLTRSLERLERRVYALAHPSEVQLRTSAQRAGTSPVAQATEKIFSTQRQGIFSIPGTAMLGIAGAYLLRALAESNEVPQKAATAIAIAYAIFWLVAATRLPAETWFASTTYASTPVFILIPILWELTLRLKIQPNTLTAGVLGAFVVCATAGINFWFFSRRRWW